MLLFFYIVGGEIRQQLADIRKILTKGIPMKKIILTLTAMAFAVAFTACASSAQKASAKGYETVTTPATELEEIKADLEKSDIPSGIGMAVSNDEMVARTQAADEARAALAVSVKTTVSRYKEQYAKNVNGESAKIWEEKANEYTEQELTGATVHKTITQFNEDDGKYKVYCLVALNPEILKKTLMQAAKSEEEFMLRAESADMQARMDKAAAAYKEKVQKK